MIESIRQISLINKLFNVKENEWPRILISWVLNFLYRVSFVIGWTVVVGLFVSKYGISSLPYLFVINAVFTIFGSFIYSALLNKFKVSNIMILTIFLSVFLLIISYFLYDLNQIAFFILLIITESVFLVHFKIMLHGLIEEKFNPIESERTFPLVESSETIGGIIAGLIVVFLMSSINISSFVLILSSVVILIIPFLFLYEHVNEKVFLIPPKKINRSPISLLNKLKKELADGKHFSYIKGMFLIVFFYWFLFNLIEFQYTKAVYQNVSNVVVDSGGGFEHALVHDLGQLFILFSASALIIQLFIGGRLIKSLGIYGSMLLHPIITIFSLFGLTLSYNFQNAVLAKNNFTISSVIHLNSYHSAYYAVKEDMRSYVREFLEGIVRPIGALFGTAVLIALQHYFVKEGLVFYINISMLAVCIVIIAITYIQQSQYTSVAIYDLLHSKDKKERFDAIDILAQKGHKASIPVLKDVLLNNSEPQSVRIRILKAFCELEDVKLIKYIIKCFKSSNPTIRSSALDTIRSFEPLLKKRKKYTVIEHELVESLKKMYRSETNKENRSKIINILSNLSSSIAFGFLLKLLNSKNEIHNADIIFALGNFEDESVIDVIKPYLNSKKHDEKISAIVALGKFKSQRKNIMNILNSLIKSNNPKSLGDALFIIGELKIQSKLSLCFKNLESEDVNLKIHSSIAIAKMGFNDSVPVMVDILFSQDQVNSDKLKKLLKNVDVRICKNFDKIVKQLVSKKVEKIISEEGDVPLDDISQNNLKNLKLLYCLAEEYEEVDYINNILKS